VIRGTSLPVLRAVRPVAGRAGGPGSGQRRSVSRGRRAGLAYVGCAGRAGKAVEPPCLFGLASVPRLGGRGACMLRALGGGQPCALASTTARLSGGGLRRLAGGEVPVLGVVHEPVAGGGGKVASLWYRRLRRATPIPPFWRGGMRRCPVRYGLCPSFSGRVHSPAVARGAHRRCSPAWAAVCRCLLLTAGALFSCHVASRFCRARRRCPGMLPRACSRSSAAGVLAVVIPG